jgi:ABC-type multidrug transport system ATPase subunit
VLASVATVAKNSRVPKPHGPAGELFVRVDGREAVFAAGASELTAGGAQGNAIRLHGTGVANRHLALRFEGDGWIAERIDGGEVFRADGSPFLRGAVDGPLTLRLGDPLAGALLELGAGAPELHDRTIDFQTATSDGPTRDAAPRSIPLAADVVRLGRDPESDVVVDDVLVSRRHAEIRRTDDDRYEVVDLHSHNGTFVNGRPVYRALLDELDLVAVGRNSYRLVAGRLEESVDTGQVAYAARELTVRLADGDRVLLDRVSFSLDAGSMVAVIGPSGAGKSTLLGALTGFRPATEGTVVYDDRNLYDNYDALRRRIGYVPQDDIVHPQLTVARALEFAADIRFPGDMTSAERRARVAEVLAELGLEHRAGTRISQLSGGERKRVSVGLELLTAPALLFLDEPTTGLDPSSERRLMELFRTLADGGRTVFVVTHSMQSLRLCDRVLALAPGGQVAYFGPPQLLLAYFDREHLADVFGDLGAPVDDGDAGWSERFRGHPYHATYVQRGAAVPAAGDETPAVMPGAPRAGHRDRWRQFTTLTRRYAAVLAADRRNLALLLGQAPLLGLLLLVALPARQLGFAPPSELRLISQGSLVLLVVVLTVSWLGMSNAVREIAKELPIYRRERAAGLAPSAYLGSKVVVLGTLTIVQAAVLVGLAVSTQDGPPHAVLLGWGPGELMAVGALTGIAAMAIGLLISALAKTADRATSVLPIALVFLLVLALGGVFPQVGDKPVLKQLGYVASTRWGFAGMASTADLNNLQAVTGVLTRQPTVKVDDPSALLQAFQAHPDGDRLWRHSASAWLLDAAALLALAVLALLATALALRRDVATRQVA